MKWLTFLQYISGLFFSAGDRMWEIQSKIFKNKTKQQQKHLVFVNNAMTFQNEMKAEQFVIQFLNIFYSMWTM